MNSFLEKKDRFFSWLVVFIFLLILYTNKTLAIIKPQDVNIIPREIEQDSPLKSYEDVYDLIYNTIVVVFDAFFVLAILFLILAAYNFLTGGTNENKIKTAKSQIKYAVIAIVVALVSGGISLIIKSFLSTASWKEGLYQ